MAQDVYKRQQLDFALPGRLNASYVAEDNDRRTPVTVSYTHLKHKKRIACFPRGMSKPRFKQL